MDTRRIQEGSQLIDATSWHSIAFGVFGALAVQIVLSLLGLAIATSVGNHLPGGGYALWAMIVQLAAMAFGAAIAARMSHPGRRRGGIVAGVMTWAVTLVIGLIMPALSLTTRLSSAGAWAAFFGAVLSLAAAVFGGIVGSALGSSRGVRSVNESPRTTPTEPHPV